MYYVLEVIIAVAITYSAIWLGFSRFRALLQTDHAKIWLRQSIKIDVLVRLY